MLDTNVLVAGLLTAPGPPGRIVEAILAGSLELAFDERIRAEYADVLHRREFRFDADRVDAVLAEIDASGLHLSGLPPWPNPLPDPDDEAFIATAAAAACDLVTGNTRHFPTPIRRGVVVLTPREFLDVWRRSLA